MTLVDSFPVVPGWETVREIGRGGYGAVYEIRRIVGGEIDRAALKHISIPRSTGDVDLLRSEGMTPAEISAEFDRMADELVKEYLLMNRLIDCSNVVNCFDVRSERRKDGLGWDILIRMELLTPLLSHIETAGMSEAQAIKLGQDLCRALIFCRKHRILHRDIKPGNIMVSDDGLYKLGDFGVARTNVETGSGTVRVGTYDYMAPEVYLSEHYGAAADLYSLGIVLYWYLNRRRCPFQPLHTSAMSSEDRETARRRRFRGEPLPPPADGCEEFKRIVLKACAFDPKDRYHSPEELLRALDALENSLRFTVDDSSLDAETEHVEHETKTSEESETDTTGSPAKEEERKKDLSDLEEDGSGENPSSGGSSGGNTVISRTWNISGLDKESTPHEPAAVNDKASSGASGRGGFISSTWPGRGVSPSAPEERKPADAPGSDGGTTRFSAGSTIYSKTWGDGAPPALPERERAPEPAPAADSGSGLKYGSVMSFSPPAYFEDAEDDTPSAVDTLQGFFHIPQDAQEEPGYLADAPGAFTEESEMRRRKKRRTVIIAVSAACLVLAAALLIVWRLNAAGSGEAAGTTQTSPSPTAQASSSPAALQWAAPSYSWATDDSSVTATRVCRSDASLTETETAQTTAKITVEATCTSPGETTYTAVFQNSAFSTQAKTITGPAARGHDWQAATYTAPKTCSRCGATEGQPLQKPTQIPIPDVSGMSYSQMVDTLARAGFTVCTYGYEVAPGEDTSLIGSFEPDFGGETSAPHGTLLFLREYVPIFPDSWIRTHLDGAGLYPGESVETNAYLQYLVKTSNDTYYDYYYDFSWSSSDPSVAAVDADGTIRAVSPGSATITCTSRDKSGFSKSIPIYVLNP